MSIDYNEEEALPIDGEHGVCRSYNNLDALDIKTIEYATSLLYSSSKNIFALDLGCSPYCPQGLRLAKQGCYVDAIDLNPPDKAFQSINQSFDKRISYLVKDLRELQASDLAHQYSLIYSNRCLCFMKHTHIRHLMKLLVERSLSKTRFFISFFTVDGHYAKGYPVNQALDERFYRLTSDVAKRSSMTAPVCLYTKAEIYDEVLGELPITLIDEITASTGSLKLIFEKQ
ncbi:MAG: hypothetical protein CMF50_02015 [Legionellales bacterium]|nr:hypothetical protein [Legionellales bacterium]|tara:strand:- start:75674 stop:76360 length:687 start_codon:yes stop_codon:yes gene_type:complete